MIRTTRWSPDTCGCVLEYSWDDSQPQESREHTFARAVHLCEIHAVASPESAFEQVRSENVTKNVAQNEFTKAIPNKPFEFSFSEDRKLLIKTDHLTKAEADKVAADVISKMDTEKVASDDVKK